MPDLAPVAAPPGPPANDIEITTHLGSLEPDQLALFEPTDTATTYHEALIDHGPLRRCSACKRTLPRSCFTINRAHTDGIDYQCRDCKLAITRRTRGVAREHSNLRPPPDQTCEVCGSAGGKSGIYLDHDHLTGLFRGWLCAGCNTALGAVRDSPDLLLALVTYLETRRNRSVA